MKNETKFKDLNINSFVHYVYKDDIEVKSFEIHEITKLYIKGYFSSTVISKEYFNESIAMMDCEKYYAFTTISEAKRYAKSNMMKKLNSMIEICNEKLNKIKKFKEDNWNYLNLEYTEKEISRLEKEIKQK